MFLQAERHFGWYKEYRLSPTSFPPPLSLRDLEVQSRKGLIRAASDLASLATDEVYFAAMAPFLPQLQILPTPQRELWHELVAIPPWFTLYGGTALALHLGHRESIDFNFFGTRLIDPDEVLALELLQGATILEKAPQTLTVGVERGGWVKLSFFGVPHLPLLRPPLFAPDNQLRVASLLDIAGTKAAVVQKRAEAKDYIDIDALITHGIALPAILAAGQALYGHTFAPQSALKALCYFEEESLMSLPHELKVRLIEAVHNTELDKIPVLSVLKTPDKGDED